MRMMHVAGALALLCVLSAVPARAQENWTPIAPLELYKPDYFLMGQPDTKIQLSLKITACSRTRTCSSATVS